MIVTTYIALIHKDSDSDFGVSFPDLPGCVTAGTTLDDARMMAEEALSLHLDGMEADGVDFPEPSSLHEIMEIRENRDAVAVVVPVRGEGSRTVRVNITLPADILSQIDRYAELNGMTRSGFLAQAAKREMKAA